MSDRAVAGRDAGTIEVQATSADADEPTAGALLSVEGVRGLRRLLEASVSGGVGSGT